MFDIVDGCHSQGEGSEARDWGAHHKQDNQSTNWSQEPRDHLPGPVGETGQVRPTVNRLLSAG